MIEINKERPPVEVEKLGYDKEQLEHFDIYFQHNFRWTYNMGHSNDNKYFCSDYTVDGLYVQQDPFVKLIWQRACDKFNIPSLSKIGRCYLLGQTQGLDGPWHDDYDVNENPNIRTLLYYPIFNPHRKHKGTQFKFEHEDEVEIQEVPYEQDSAVFFDAGVTHRGLSTTDTKSLRVSLVWQCVDVNIQMKHCFEDTCGNDERLDNIIGPIIPG
tara:strand:- start:1720 stop:2358 length:639 start_codon:yes stop_codon:yes gene_type:complete